MGSRQSCQYNPPDSALQTRSKSKRRDSQLSTLPSSDFPEINNRTSVHPSQNLSPSSSPSSSSYGFENFLKTEKRSNFIREASTEDERCLLDSTANAERERPWKGMYFDNDSEFWPKDWNRPTEGDFLLKRLIFANWPDRVETKLFATIMQFLVGPDDVYTYKFFLGQEVVYRSSEYCPYYSGKIVDVENLLVQDDEHGTINSWDQVVPIIEMVNTSEDFGLPEQVVDQAVAYVSIDPSRYLRYINIPCSCGNTDTQIKLEPCCCLVCTKCGVRKQPPRYYLCPTCGSFIQSAKRKLFND